MSIVSIAPASQGPSSQTSSQTPARATRSPFGRLMLMLGIARERRALHQLDDALLRDIGLTRHEAQREAARAAWDAPNRYWYKS